MIVRRSNTNPQVLWSKTNYYHYYIVDISTCINNSYALIAIRAHCACAIFVRRGQLYVAMMASARASEGEAVCVMEGVVHGHHIYKETWTPTVGEKLAVLQEAGNDHNRHAMCIR